MVDTEGPTVDEQRAAYYRANRDHAGRINLLEDRERICPYCKDTNPCTGVDHCVSCGNSLRGAKRANTSRFDPTKY